MGSFSFCLATIFCCMGLVIGNTQQKIGPCVVDTNKLAFNCSGRLLTKTPSHIWTNVTMLDISQNHLNLRDTKIQSVLWKLEQLVVLNLSGNYLPLLERDSLGTHSFLQVLDLSRCGLSGITAGALKSFPRLQILFVGDNELHWDHLPSPEHLDLRHDWPVTIDSVSSLSDMDNMDKGKKYEEHHHRIFWKFQRKLLSLAVSTPGTNSTDAITDQSTKSWPYLVAVLLTAIGTSILIALVAKCKLFHRYLASYRHSRLPEGDTASQYVPEDQEMNFSRHVELDQGTVLEDDDGFIEDNYIQPIQQRPDRVIGALHYEEDKDQFTIG